MTISEPHQRTPELTDEDPSIEADPIVPYDPKIAEGQDVIRASDFLRVARPARRMRQPLLEYRSHVSVFWGLYIITLCLVTSLLYWHSSLAPYLAATRAQVFEAHQYWRLVTAVLVHADLAHLLSNSLLFLFFSWHLQSYGGALLFPGLAMIAGVLTHAVSLWTYSDQVRLVGASGMVYAMVGLWLLIYMVRERRYKMRSKLARMLGFILVVLMPSSIIEQVSYRAHAIGFLVGVVLGAMYILFDPSSSEKVDPSSQENAR